MSNPVTSQRQVKPRLSDFMSILRELEVRFPVNEWRVGDIPIWPLLRTHWVFSEWRRHYTTVTNEPPKTPGVGTRLKCIIGSAIAACKANRVDAAGKAGSGLADILFLSNGISFSKLDSRWVERFCDPLIAAAKRANLSSLLWTPLRLYYQPRFTPSTFIQPFLDTAHLLGLIRRQLKPLKPYLPEHTALISWLTTQGYDTNLFQISTLIANGCHLRAVANAYHHRLTSVRPKFAFINNYCSLNGMAFVLACHELAIPVADIQHGVQGEHHPAYAGWPINKERCNRLLPNYFWVWSNAEAAVIKAWSTGTGHVPFVGGNPWLSLWSPDSHWPGIATAIADAQNLYAKANGCPIVLVTLQFGLAPAEQIEPLKRLMLIVGDRLKFWVRLHPGMLERREEIRARLSGTSFELDASSDLPLPALLTFVNVHLTHSSSTVIEAAQFGIHSVLTTPYGEELFQAQIDNGVAVLETGDAQQLASTLLHLSSMKKESAALPNIDQALYTLLVKTNIQC